MEEVENVPTFDVFTENISLTEIRKTLGAYLYDKNDNCIGRLSDFHFKYDVNRNCLFGER